MKELSLRERLIRYFEKHHTDWLPSGAIQRLVVEYTTQTPRTAVRRLQELAEEGILERKLIKNHTHYRLKEKEVVSKQQILSDNQKLIQFFEDYPIKVL